MKKLTILILIFSLAGFTSCERIIELLGGSTLSRETVDEITFRNEELRQKIREDSIMHIQELNMLREQYERDIEALQKQPALQKDVTGYLVVVGSFKNKSYAEKFSSKIKGLGYEGAMLDGPNEFTVVTSSTYSNLRDAIGGLTTARNELANDAWVYVKR